MQKGTYTPYMVLGIALLAFAADAVCKAWAEPAAVRVKPKTEETDPVSAALLAEVVGDRDGRTRLLSDAIKKCPESSLAHWYAGEVRRDGRWVSLEEAERQAAADPRLTEYHKLRDQQAGTPAGQVVLARWCRDQGLTAESRVHWTQAIMAQPDNSEALKALGAKWHQGRLLTDAQIRQVNEANSTGYVSPSNRASIDRWASQLALWRRAAKQDEASIKESLRREVASLSDPRNINELGTALIIGARRKNDPKGCRLVSLALIDALKEYKQSWAAVQLARQAVEHPMSEVRDTAVDALKDRPKESYVPWLLSQMQSPIDMRIIVTPCYAGGVSMQQTLEWEGPDAIYRDNCQRYYYAGMPQINIVGNARRMPIRTTNIPQIAQKSWRDAGNYAAGARNQVERFNATVEDVNQRVQTALTRATGEKMNTDPGAWQRWWTKYCCNYYELGPTIPDPSTAGQSDDEYPYSYEQPPSEEKPVVERQRSYGAPATVVLNIVVTPTGSCFPWNTRVWTQTGPVEIRQVKPGDRVLSQHPFTGELSYQPVLQITRRRSSPMIEIGLGGETIRATRGHPFWVCGRGWKMAKELAVGMYLHSTDGPILIDRLDQVPAAEPWYERPDGKPGEDLSYNLVMDECHNYFVGQQKVLVHDNTLFPLDGPVPAVPGLTASNPASRPNPAGKPD